MKKTIVFLAVVLAFLNLPSTTKQCINFKCSQMRIPLYQKALGFLDRHYSYARLTRTILDGAPADKGRLLKLFEWTSDNIRRVPEGYPVIDDHVWSIITRGYGASDQSADVFVTLCHYARIQAFYRVIYSLDKKRALVISFARLEGDYRAFDTYNGTYFLNREGEFARTRDLKEGTWRLKADKSSGPAVDYQEFFNNLPDEVSRGFDRGSIQSPLTRFIYAFREWVKRKK